MPPIYQTHMKEKFEKLVKSESFRQLIKYGIVGVVGLVIDMGVYYLLVTRFSVHYPFTEAISGKHLSIGMLDIIVSNIISSTLAVINNFILNSYFTFKVTDNKFKRFLSFAGIAAVGMVVSSALLTVFIEYMGLNDLIAKGFAVIIVAMLQFIINKFFTFKGKKN